MILKVIILILGLLLTAAAGPVLAAPRIHTQGGSLVIEGEGGKAKATGDTLYELLGQEVQVYIFNHQTRIWPQVRVRSGAGSRRICSAIPKDPRVAALIQKYACKNGVDPGLVRAVIRHESGFNPEAVSPKGAQGLMQLMPGTAAGMGVTNPFDPEQNIAGGVGYLRRCLERFGHNVALAVAAYNAGPERVAQCGTVPPIQETQAFVANVMGTYTGEDQQPVPAVNNSPPPNDQVIRSAAPNTTAENTPRRPRPKIIDVQPE